MRTYITIRTGKLGQSVQLDMYYEVAPDNRNYSSYLINNYEGTQRVEKYHSLSKDAGELIMQHDRKNSGGFTYRVFRT